MLSRGAPYGLLLSSKYLRKNPIQILPLRNPSLSRLGLHSSSMESGASEHTVAVSKKAAKKEAAKQEKLRKRHEAVLAASVSAVSVEDDPLRANYGNVSELQAEEMIVPNVTDIAKLTEELEAKEVVITGRAQAIRVVSKNMVFVVVRHRGCTVQCVVTAQPDVVSKQMVKFVSGLSKESIVDVHGFVSLPKFPITGASQQVELQVRKLYCISKAMPTLPFNIEDASRSEKEIEEASKREEQVARVNQDTRLNYRVLDLRTLANQAIIQIRSEVLRVFRQFLYSEDFVEVDTPKLMAGTSEGGSAVFKFNFYGQPACLAQSPQLHKQMLICADAYRVFEVNPVFRAENSYTHRHLCEFRGLDVEMEIRRHYSEVIDVVDRLFVVIFDWLNQSCKKLLEAIQKQYPFEPLKYRRKTLQLRFEEGVQMLKEAGIEIDPFGDLSTEAERKLGQLVSEKYGTDFYILHRYPLGVRPFYTMPCVDDDRYSNSFDVFIRGEEIISGAQRIHEPDLLEERAKTCGIDVNTISTYIDSFRYGAPRHGGFGVGLERVVMLFCGLDNVRKTSLFPRDPHRLAP